MSRYHINTHSNFYTCVDRFLEEALKFQFYGQPKVHFHRKNYIADILFDLEREQQLKPERQT